MSGRDSALGDAGRKLVFDHATRLQRSADPSVDPTDKAQWNRLSRDQKFGKRQFNVPHEYRRWDYLRAESTGRRPYSYRVSPSKRETQLHKGFYRRPASKITEEYTGPAYSKVKEERSRLAAHQRSEKLLQHQQRNGPNAVFEGGDVLPRGRRHFARLGLSDEYQRESQIRMRNEAGRFFRDPAAPGTTARRTILAQESVSPLRKSSSVIGYGRSEIPSKGAADGLEASVYGAPPAALSDTHRAAAQSAVRPPWLD
mmetsp:Transcript_11229/g.35797  ORF Transcript_11229/g.35797 Transcript_11229/m.35797 type:complete len:256 (+) Transcript_11229:16-783(+)